MSRLDGRSLHAFKRHIKFTTEMESRLMKLWAESPSSGCDWYANNGVDNNGEYVADGTDTSDVDFVASVNGREQQLELKFVPTHGKLTLKSADVANYIRKGAGILFIINTSKVSLKVPKEKCIESHWNRVLDTYNAGKLRWAILDSDKLHLIKEREERVSIPYMGGKPGYIIKSESFADYMRLRKF